MEQALREKFSFAARAFGQPVMLSEVIAAVQAVAGVIAVDVDKLYRSGRPRRLQQRLLAELPVLSANGQLAGRGTADVGSGAARSIGSDGMSFDARKVVRTCCRRSIGRATPSKASRCSELLAVIAEQAGVLEENLEQLYDDQFIETCGDWVVPYIGDLIGYRSLHGVVPKVASPRAEVAHTIAFRRRKGTATMLEQLARDVTGWPARVVECFQILGWTQNMNHVRPEAHYAPNLRDWEKFARLNRPFDRNLHTIDVRRIAKGRANTIFPISAIYLWRLGAYRLRRSPAVPVAPGDTQRFLFDPLGRDTQLFTRPERENEITISPNRSTFPTRSAAACWRSICRATTASRKVWRSTAWISPRSIFAI